MAKLSKAGSVLVFLLMAGLLIALALDSLTRHEHDELEELRRGD